MEQNKCILFLLIAIFSEITYSCGNHKEYYEDYYRDLKNKIEDNLDVSAFDELQENAYYDNDKEEYKDVIKYARIIADKKNPMYGDDVFDLYEMAGLLSNPLHLDTALIYLKKSVQAGNQFAACKLRRMYQEGEYVEVNLDSAYYYFKLAPDLQKWIKDTLIRSMRSESEISK